MNIVLLLACQSALIVFFGFVLLHWLGLQHRMQVLTVEILVAFDLRGKALSLSFFACVEMIIRFSFSRMCVIWGLLRSCPNRIELQNNVPGETLVKEIGRQEQEWVERLRPQRRSDTCERMDRVDRASDGCAWLRILSWADEEPQNSVACQTYPDIWQKWPI